MSSHTVEDLVGYSLDVPQVQREEGTCVWPLAVCVVCFALSIVEGALWFVGDKNLKAGKLSGK